MERATLWTFSAMLDLFSVLLPPMRSTAQTALSPINNPIDIDRLDDEGDGTVFFALQVLRGCRWGCNLLG